MTGDQHNKWKLETLNQLCRASLLAMGEIDRDKHSYNQNVHLTVLEEDLNINMRLLPTKSKAIPAPRPIPIFTNIPAPDAVVNTSNKQALPSASSDVASQSVRREGKIIVCQLCGESKKKRSDMDDHLASKHEIGSLRVCPICNHNVSTKWAMKQHIRGQQKGISHRNVILKDASSKELTEKMPTMYTKLILTKGKLKDIHTYKMQESIPW